VENWNIHRSINIINHKYFIIQQILLCTHNCHCHALSLSLIIIYHYWYHSSLQLLSLSLIIIIIIAIAHYRYRSSFAYHCTNLILSSNKNIMCLVISHKNSITQWIYLVKRFIINHKIFTHNESLIRFPSCHEFYHQS